ncbi:HTH binding domain protein [Salmonella phage 21]|nr:HTH binding domain protein [Salmonella phage 21]
MTNKCDYDLGSNTAERTNQFRQVIRSVQDRLMACLTGIDEDGNVQRKVVNGLHLSFSCHTWGRLLKITFHGTNGSIWNDCLAPMI